MYELTYDKYFDVAWQSQLFGNLPNAKSNRFFKLFMLVKLFLLGSVDSVVESYFGFL